MSGGVGCYRRDGLIQVDVLHVFLRLYIMCLEFDFVEKHLITVHLRLPL